jgi:hypothetical protein
VCHVVNRLNSVKLVCCLCVLTPLVPPMDPFTGVLLAGALACILVLACGLQGLTLVPYVRVEHHPTLPVGAGPGHWHNPPALPPPPAVPRSSSWGASCAAPWLS